jgi:hypothetical protein
MMRIEGSPYRKAAAMVPLHFRRLPRRSRLLLIAVFCICVLWFLPRVDLGIGKTLSFLLFGPGFAGHHKPRVDILRFVDPLIGTANGGLCGVIPTWNLLSDGLQAMYSPAQLCPTVSTCAPVLPCKGAVVLLEIRNGKGSCRHGQPC